MSSYALGFLEQRCSSFQFLSAIAGLKLSNHQNIVEVGKKKKKEGMTRLSLDISDALTFIFQDKKNPKLELECERPELFNTH